MNRERIAEMLAGLGPLAERINGEPEPTTRTPVELLSALNEFTEIVRYRNTRRSKSNTLKLESEADVQDALYMVLRPWVRDLVSENPAGKTANRYTVADFTSASARTVIEAKFIRDVVHGKSVTKEMNDDIEQYRQHPDCDHLIFFLWDPDTLIADKEALRSHYEIPRVIGGKSINCYVVVKPG